MSEKKKKQLFRIFFGIVAPQLLGMLLYSFFLSASRGSLGLDRILFYALLITVLTMTSKSVVYAIVVEFITTKLVPPVTGIKRFINVMISIVYWAIVGWIPLVPWSFIPATVIGAVSGICFLFVPRERFDEPKHTEKKLTNEAPVVIIWICPVMIVLCGIYLYFQQASYKEQPIDHTYFPEKLFGESKEVHDFTVSLYTRNLKALKEPSIYKQRNESSKKVFRFTWLRSFDRPIAVRLEVQPDGSGLLYTKMTYGEGGYTPGRIKRNRKTKIAKEKVNEFLKLIEEKNFWHLPSIEDSNGIGMDGAQWIVEGLWLQEYHLVDRWSPEDGAVREIGMFLVDLSDLKVKQIY